MKDKTIAIYGFIDDLLITICHKEPLSRNAFYSHIITTAILAGIFFNGHMQNAISFNNSLFTKKPGKSRFNRRVHAVFELIITLFFRIAEAVNRINIRSHYSIDSFLVSVCENVRIRRSKIITGEINRGYQASKRDYFYGSPYRF